MTDDSSRKAILFYTRVLNVFVLVMRYRSQSRLISYRDFIERSSGHDSDTFRSAFRNLLKLIL